MVRPCNFISTGLFDVLPRDEWERERERQLLVFNEPELRGAILEQFADGLGMIAEFAAERTGRSPDDFEVRNWAGAVIGVILAAFYQAGGDPFKNYIQVIDEGFAHLEAGLPL